MKFPIISVIVLAIAFTYVSANELPGGPNVSRISNHPTIASNFFRGYELSHTSFLFLLLLDSRTCCLSYLNSSCQVSQ